MDEQDKREKLKEFYLEIKDCNRCELSKSRTKFVFGSGSAYAEIMFVGEAPGKNEDLQGLPFVGQAGKLLDELLGSIGYERSEVFIANVLKCRPPGNRDPKVDEVNICKGYLIEQIKIIDPKIICTMGRYSTRLLLNTDRGINGLRGKVYKIDNRIIMPINHPAAALYTPSRMDILRQDFQKIKKLIDSGGDLSCVDGEILNLENEVKTHEENKNEQLGLF
ncbi:MAG: uracil-DNA glycosylase [Candidatus Humimicrobiaceae bacterium]|jgi:DNA polymerase|nr:uracil-DNA glycosylase [Actinomycetota bacterium]MDY0027801.1 uracil-DNA glycosylase [Candidatus Humimicrobiaceae bacterium]